MTKGVPPAQPTQPRDVPMAAGRPQTGAPTPRALGNPAPDCKTRYADLRSEEWVWVGSRTRLPFNAAQKDSDLRRLKESITLRHSPRPELSNDVLRAGTGRVWTGWAGSGRAGPANGAD